MSHSTTPSRFRANSKPAAANRVLLSPPPKPRPKSVSPDVTTNSKTRRSLLPNKPKSGEQAKTTGVEDVRLLGRPANRSVLEQFALPRRPTFRRNEDGSTDEKKKGLQETLIRGLQSEVLALKAELDKAQSFNEELQSQNRKLAADLAAAETKIAALSGRDQRESIAEYQSSKFKDIQKLIANKLEYSKVKKDTINEPSIGKTPPWQPPPPSPTHPISKAANSERRASAFPSPPPPLPPPPPPPPRLPARAAAAQKAPSIVELYHSLTKQDGKRYSTRPENHNKPAVVGAHSSIVGEIQNRSAHLLAIKADIETKGEFINGLIQKVLAAAYTDIEDVLKFVDWLDSELSSLADERAVLKHFKWPERKADAMREAAIEYRELKLLGSEISSYKDDPDIPCGAALKKMARLLDKSEQSIQRLIKLRNSVIRSYQDCKIPIDWMLDSGIVSKIKQASMKLAQIYMKRVTIELEFVRNSDREATQEALLLQGVHFAYRAHQFAGGLDSETLCAFEEIRQRVPGLIGGSQELLAGIPSS